MTGYNMNLFAVAVKNIKQNSLRSVAIMTAIGALSAILFSLSLTYIALMRSVELSAKRLGADAMIVPLEYAEKAEDVLLTGKAKSFFINDYVPLREALLKTDGVQAVSAQLFVISAPHTCCTVSDTMLIGYEPETDFVISPWIKENIRKGKLAPNEIVVGANILAGTGGRQMFYGQEFLIVGKLEPTGMRFLDSAVFIPMAGVRRMVDESRAKAILPLEIGKNEISAVLVKLKGEETTPEKFAIRFEYNMPGKKVLLMSGILSNAKKQLIAPLKGMAVIFAFQWAVSLFLIWVIYKLSIDERRVELGVMKALGACKNDIRKMLFMEIAMLSGFGGFAGIIAGFLLVRLFSGFLKNAYKAPLLLPDYPTLLLLSIAVFATSLFSGILASFFTTLKWSKIETFYLMRGGPERKGQNG